MPETEKITLEGLLSSVELRKESAAAGTVAPLVTTTDDDGLAVAEKDRTYEEEQRFIASLAAAFKNLPEDFSSKQFERKKKKLNEEERALLEKEVRPTVAELEAKPLDKQHIQNLIGYIDGLINDQLDEILHHEDFKAMEATWLGIDDLVSHTNFKKDIQIGLLDVSKAKAYEDLELNSADIAASEVFKKLYIAEYDQYGGEPYGAIIGMYEFANTPDDMNWLSTIGKIATAAHAPFVGSVAPKFFGCKTMAEVNELRDIVGMMDTPKYAKWNALRKTEQAVYLGLTLPKYIVRTPYNQETNPAREVESYEEAVGADDEDFVWATSAILFARNLVRSFETSGWCQHIRGPKGGGKLDDLVAYEYDLRGEQVLKLPVEIAMPDFREYDLARAGFIPLVQKKSSAEAVFFSAQSIKFVDETFVDLKKRENSQLISNLSYTYSIARIAHYLKCMMRDNIGSTANASYVYNQIDRWISRYVTTLVNPDDITLRYYPFKAYSLSVDPIEGKIGWYHCNLSILPHIQFEGMNVDLRVDANLG